MKVLAVDTETTGTDFWHGCRPFMVSSCDGKQNTIWQGSVHGPTREVTWDTGELFELQYRLDKAECLVFHNTNFDIKALTSVGILHEHLWDKIDDTLLASHCLCSSDVHGLKELAIKYLRYGNNDETDLQEAVVQSRTLNPTWAAKRGHKHFPAIKNTKFWKMDLWHEPELCRKYAIHDAQRTWLLWKTFKAGLHKEGLWQQYLCRKELLKICYNMREYGIHLYKDKCKELYEHLSTQREQIRELIQTESKAEYDINPAKAKSLQYLLYTVLKLPVINSTDKGKPATDAKTLDLLLEDLDTPVVKLIKAWRLVDKKRSSVASYLNWSHQSRLHSSINITGTHWTRQSSSDPNQQNFDKSMKHLFGPPEGFYWFYCDVVNIELCIWAYDVGAKALIECFERGESVHMIIARALYPEMLAELGEEGFKATKTYTKCKGGTFARIYGGGVYKVNATYGIEGACDVIDQKIPEVGAYFKWLNAEMAKNCDKWGYPCIFTTQGYRLDVPVNAPHSVPSGRVQGTAGIIVQHMMRGIVKDPYYQVCNINMNQQVHDSLTFEIPNHEDEEFTNKYLHKRLEEIGREQLKALRLEYEIIKPNIEEQKLIDYKFITKEIGNYKVQLYKKFNSDVQDYFWFMDIQDKSDRTNKRRFIDQWRQPVIDKAVAYIESEIPF